MVDEGRAAASGRSDDASRIHELALRYAGDGIVALDSHSRLLFANPAARRMLESEGEPLRDGVNVHDRIHAAVTMESEHGCAIAAVLRGDGPVSAADAFCGPAGTLIDVELTCSPMREGAEVTGCVLVFRRRLEPHRDEARLISSVGRLAGALAHKFNNVLMGIQPFAEIVQRRAAGDPALQQAAAQIRTAVTRGRRTTDDILRETQLPPTALQAVDVARWLPEAGAEIAKLVGESVVLSVDSGAAALPARFDPAQVQQVLTNLALNALDAMPRGGTLTISARDTISGGRQQILVAVTDTGSGIAPDVLRHVFEPLFTTKRNGLGLGLAVAQQLSARNGATLSVTSTPGSGTTFSLLMARAEEDSRGTGSARGAAPGRRLLLVHDDEALVSALRQPLEAGGIAVEAIPSGRDSIRWAAEFAPDAIVLDAALTQADRRDLRATIAHRWPGVPVILARRASGAGVPEAQLHEGVRYLDKPYDAGALLDVLRGIV